MELNLPLHILLDNWMIRNWLLHLPTVTAKATGWTDVCVRGEMNVESIAIFQNKFEPISFGHPVSQKNVTFSVYPIIYNQKTITSPF